MQYVVHSIVMIKVVYEYCTYGYFQSLLALRKTNERTVT